MEKQYEAPTERSLLIAHMGDQHLRDAQYATPRRGEDFFEAFYQAVKDCIKADVDVFVSAGDTFNVSRPSMKNIGQILRINQLLVDAEKPMFCCQGNHDMSRPSWITTLFPDNTTVGIIDIDDREVAYGGFKFGAISHRTPETWRKNQAEIERFAEELDVLVYHGFVRGIVDLYTPKDVLNIEEFPKNDRLKAILLGDLHKQGYVRRGNVLAGFCGSLEMCEVSEDMDKSVPLVRLTKDAATIEDKVVVPIRPFIYREVRTKEEADELIADLQSYVDGSPVCVVEFDRNMPELVGRVHAVLDAQRSVIRMYPLAVDKTSTERKEHDEEGEVLDLDHFVMLRFTESGQTLRETAARLTANGSSDAAYIFQEFIAKRKEELAIRDADEFPGDEE